MTDMTERERRVWADSVWSAWERRDLGSFVDAVGNIGATVNDAQHMMFAVASLSSTYARQGAHVCGIVRTGDGMFVPAMAAAINTDDEWALRIIAALANEDHRGAYDICHALLHGSDDMDVITDVASSITFHLVGRAWATHQAPHQH